MHARLETNHHLSKKYYDKNLWCRNPKLRIESSIQKTIKQLVAL